MKSWKALLERLQEALRKNGKLRLALLVFLSGAALYLAAGWRAPTQRQETDAETAAQAVRDDAALEQRLEEVLAEIAGVGRVQVLLTLQTDAQQVYQTDVSGSGDSEQTKTVLSGGSGLLRTVTAPVYRGAVVVCEGGDRPSVVLAVQEAVRSATGLGNGQISVMKMKN